MSANLWHRRVALVSAMFLLVTAVTGILWAYAPHLYFKEGYLKKKRPVAALSIRSAKVTVAEAVDLALADSPGATIDSVSLRVEGGVPLYEVRLRKGKETSSVLVDAVVPKRLSPLSEALVARIAGEYVTGNPSLIGVKHLQTYRHRSGKLFHDVAEVSFNAPENPHICIDRHSAAIVEEYDDSRALHFAVMRLHQLQFFGFKKELTLIPGLAVIFLTMTGLWIYARRYRKNRR